MTRKTNTPSFLIASPQLEDPNFKRAVILLIDHKASGALGFVLNRPGAVPLKDMVDIEDVEIPSDILAWYGGPVETESGIIIHNQAYEEDATEITESILISSTPESLERILADTKEDQVLSEKAQKIRRLYPYRFIVGYSGWGPKQLDQEIKMGAWIQTPLDSELIFNVPWQDMWEVAIGSMGSYPTTVIPQHSIYLN